MFRISDFELRISGLAALLVLAGAFALCLVNCSRGVMADELTTRWAAGLPAPQLVEERLAHNHLPTYFLLMRVWLQAAGASAVTLRLPSMVAGALTVAVLFLICRRRFSAGLSLAAAALLSVNATHLFVSQWSRMYGLTALLEVVFFGCFLADLAAPTWKRYLAYSGVVVAGCALHLLFLQMAVVAGGLLLWERLAAVGAQAGRRPLRRDLTRYLAPFLAGIVLLWLWSQHAQTLHAGREPAAALSWLDHQTAPVPFHDGGDAVSRARRIVDPSRAMLQVAFGGTSYWPWLQSGWLKYPTRAALYLAAVGLLWAAFRRPGNAGNSWAVGAGSPDLEQWRATRFAVLWAVLPPLMMMLGGMVFTWVPAPHPRWLAGGAAAWALLLACGVWQLPGGGRRRFSALAALLVLFAFLAWGWLRYPGDGLRETFAYWQAHAARNDKVFLAHRGYLEEALKFEGYELPPFRSGTSVDHRHGAEVARRLEEFAGTNTMVWVLHYRHPQLPVLREAVTLLAPRWRADLSFDSGACSVFRLTRADETY